MNLQFFKSACRMFATETKEKVPFVKQSLLQRVLHIRKVSRVNSGGKIRSISALVVVGNQNGSAGYGMGRGTDTATAVQKALVQAQKNLQPILRLDNRTIYSDIEYQYHRVNLTLRTAKPGIEYLIRTRSCCKQLHSRNLSMCRNYRSYS
jgi:ribosomal protein S5